MAGKAKNCLFAFPRRRFDNVVRPSFFLLDSVRERHLFYYQQRRRSPPPSFKTCLFMETVEGPAGRKQSGGNAEEKLLARSDPPFVEADVLAESERNMRSRCFKGLDLRLSPCFLHQFTQRCFFRLKELVSRQKRRSVFPGCLCSSKSGTMWKCITS